jgi:hypothetical protein
VSSERLFISSGFSTSSSGKPMIDSGFPAATGGRGYKSASVSGVGDPGASPNAFNSEISGRVCPNKRGAGRRIRD